MKWMVVRVRPQYMARAIINMERQEYECYAPHAMMRSGRGARLTRQALFPGYVFARHAREVWASLTGTYGVLGVVMGTAARPAVLPHAEIERIRAREGPDGLVRLASQEFHVGERVHVETDLLSLDAIVDGMSGPDRIFVLMQGLGRWARVEVNVGDVTRA